MNALIRFTLLATVLGLGAGPALAKLPPPTEEAKAKAAEAKLKADEAAKVAAEQLAAAQDRVAAMWRAKTSK